MQMNQRATGGWQRPRVKWNNSPTDPRDLIEKECLETGSVREREQKINRKTLRGSKNE